MYLTAIKSYIGEAKGDSTLLISAPGRWRQVNPCEFEAIQHYTVSPYLKKKFFLIVEEYEMGGCLER